MGVPPPANTSPPPHPPPHTHTKPTSRVSVRPPQLAVIQIHQQDAVAEHVTLLRLCRATIEREPAQTTPSTIKGRRGGLDNHIHKTAGKGFLSPHDDHWSTNVHSTPAGNQTDFTPRPRTTETLPEEAPVGSISGAAYLGHGRHGRRTRVSSGTQ